MANVAAPGSVVPGTELKGKVALITGAGRNIGRAIALDLAAGGAAIAVNTRKSREDAEKVAQEVRAAGGQADVFMADIVDADAVNKMVEAIVKRFGKVDILVLNASVRKETPFMEMSFEEWKSLISITLDGAFHCTKACLPHMVKAGGGSIVTLGGANALSGSPKRVHGSTGKHGLWGMTRALAKELGPYGINVNCVVPGPMIGAAQPGRSPRGDASGVPLGRRVEYEEIATLTRYLCGPGARMVSGQLMYVDGGQQQF
jgi:3-oxoacyl-[acyl-carrier protein] reductase